MPNHCENLLTITGPSHSVHAFVHQAKDREGRGENRPGDFSIGQFLPMPEELRNTVADFRPRPEQDRNLIDKYGASNWYDWAFINWGTKWGSYDSELVDLTLNMAQFTYWTAWGPLADHAMTKVSEMYPDLDIFVQYFETGMYFSGNMHFKNGELTDENYADNLSLAYIDHDPFEDVDDEDQHAEDDADA